MHTSHLGYTEQPSPQVPQNVVVAENDNDTEEGNYGSQASSESDDNNWSNNKI